MDNKSRKKIMPAGDVFLVISEPGDATLYDYFVFRDGPDNFCFMPRKSTFRFPQRLNYWETTEWTDEIICDISDKEKCNPHTVLECVRTMQEIFNKG